MIYLLQHLLSESAARFPHCAALRFNGRALTYTDLEQQTNQLARALQRAGVRRGDRVGIYLNKAPASVIAVFGILKAGAAYVPLDTGAPPIRLAYIMRDCDVNVLLTSTEKLEALRGLFDEGAPLTTIVILDALPEQSAEVDAALRQITWDRVREEIPDTLPDSGAIETDLAYILYTSGSTGDPKGVMITHKTIFTFVNWAHDTFQLTSSDRVTSHAPLHFDLSTFDIYVTIKAGATIVLVPDKLSIFPVKLVQLLQDERITVTYLVPSILSLMVRYGELDAHDLTALRAILFAGEVFPIDYLRQLVDQIPEAAYYNLYGPTETNVCTYYKVQAPDLRPERTRPVPIGVACENIEVFAVDDGGALVVQSGVEGELWVRGSCVALGYWGDPEKSAEVFVHNRFQPYFDEVAYRTGDIVVLDEDGRNWRFVGRRDHMIKSRGYRIELGEVESVLYSHRGIEETAVVAIPDDSIGNRIKAYVVPVDNQQLDEKQVRNHCRSRLPGYMVPELIEFLDALPKTSTGKVNRPQLASQNRAARSNEG